MEGALAIIFIFGGFAAIIISLIYFRNRRIERTALIAAGKDASLFSDGKPKHYLSLKYGMLLVGLAIGVILGGVLEATTTMTEPAAYLSMVLLWGGLSLIVFYGVHKKVLSDE
jgi:CBS domain containing-hemolysin-like protein